MQKIIAIIKAIFKERSFDMEEYERFTEALPEDFDIFPYFWQTR